MEIEKRCKWCGKSFIAHKMTTLYCCHTCNGKAYKEQKRQERMHEYLEEQASKPLHATGIVGDKPFLSPNELALLLGLSRASVYRYMVAGTIKALQFRGRTVIRRSDVEKMFNDSPDYKRHGSYKRKENIPYYTLTEIEEKYHIMKKTIYRRCKQYGIQKITEGCRTYYSKKAIDTYFAELIEDFDKNGYYTIEQIIEKYGMSASAVRTFVMRYNVPRIKRSKQVYYLRAFIDNIKEKGTKTNPDYYTYEEIKQKYGFTTINISYYVNKYDIKRFKEGVATMVSRDDFDRIIRERKEGITNKKTLIIESKEKTLPSSAPTLVPELDPIPEGYCSAEEIAEKYKIVKKRVWKLTKQNNIPRITVKGIYYYENKGVEAFFAKYHPNDDVKEWISPKRMEELYEMTSDARRSFAHRHHIPTKTEFGNVFYSKDHIDKIKSNGFDDRDNYYSVTEAMEKFNLRRDEVYSFIRYNKIQKMRQGNTVFLLKSDFDRIINDKLSEL